ncbi:MAG: hypothetical protein K6G90_09520 [Clostridia bacterium]|nr:hypothetical protein [Clostridia bacterium]
MKKLISVVILTTVLLSGLVSLCFAENKLDVIYDTTVSEDGSTLELKVTAVSAVGLQSGDLCVAYDESKYEFVTHKVLAPGDLTVSAGKALEEDGLLTCSFITVNEVTADMCDENGDLPLVVYTMKVLSVSGNAVAADENGDPVGGSGDTPDGGDTPAQGDPVAEGAEAAAADPAEDFFMYVVSAGVNDAKVQVPAKGNARLAEEHDTGGVKVPPNDGKYVIEDPASEKKGISWYVIAIVFVVVIAGAVIVALAVRKKDAPDASDEKKAESADNASGPVDESNEKQ